MPVRTVENMPPTALDTDTDDRCCICLDTIVDGARVHLPCGHDSFCGQCLVTHLLMEVRCPVCRQGNEDADNDSFISDEEMPVLHFNNRKVAMDKARKDKKNKQTMKSLGLMRKWNLEATALSRVYSEMQEKTREAEKVMHKKVELYESQLNEKFTRKYGKIVKQAKEYRKKQRFAAGRASAIKERLCRKYANEA